ncbi:hypothetical protein ACWC9U_22280, partial [Streptomyces sp. 900116325]
MYLGIARHRQPDRGIAMARRHSSPEDFQLLGMDSDPTPGDAGSIQQIAKRYREIGDAAERAKDLLKKEGAIDRGTGSAMEQLKAKITDDLPDKLEKTKTSYHDAAQAYTTYLPRLQEAQTTFDRAVDRARAAAPQANQTPRQVGADPTDQEKAQARTLQNSIDAGQAEMSAARSLAEQAKGMRESAQRLCAQVLDQAAGEAIPERNVFQKIADFFKEFPFVEIILSILIAVAAVFFPVVGALLGGALFLFNQVVASQTGGVKPGDFITGLLGIIPGGALLKFGSRAAQAISPALTAAVKNSSLITKSTGLIGKFSEGLTNPKVVGGFLTKPAIQSGIKTGAEVTGNFLGNSAIEAASKAANGDPLTGASVFAGAAAGAVAGGLFKAGVGAIGKQRGNPPVEEGQSGRFGDTTEPSVTAPPLKRASDQLGSFVEEGATLGTKIGVGVAQGGDPKEVAAGEIANSASKLGVGAIGKAGLGRHVDNVTDKIPFKGGPRPAAPAPIPSDATPPSPPAPRPGSPVDSAPGSPVDSRPGSPVDSASGALDSQSGDSAPRSPVDSAPGSPVD